MKNSKVTQHIHSDDNREVEINNIVNTLKSLPSEELGAVSMLAKLLKSGDLPLGPAIEHLEYIVWDYADLMLSDETRCKDKRDGTRLLTLAMLKGVFVNKMYV